MRYASLQRAGVLVIAGLLSLLTGGYLTPELERAGAAQRSITPEEEAWIQTAVSRMDVDSDDDRRELTGCLRARLSTGTPRFDAVADCYAKYQEARLSPEEIVARLVPEVAREAAEEFGAPPLSHEEFISERQRLIEERTAQLLEALRRWGATPEQLTALRGPLSACIAAWGTVALLSIVKNSAGDPIYQLDETVVDWCAEDLPDFGTLRRKQPTLTSLGCPDPVIQDRPFACAPVIEGDATTFTWTIGGGTSVEGRGASLSAGTVGTATISLRVCNGDPDPGTAGNCAQMTVPVTVEPRLPVVASPGCPATAPRGQAVTCTPTGVANTTAATTWGWTASNGDLVSDSQPTLTVTFNLGGAQVVTVLACNGTRACGEPVSQSVQITEPVGPAQSARVRLDKDSFQSGEAIRFCFTLTAAGPVRFLMTFNTGMARVLLEGTDDGRGDCLTDRVVLPQGTTPASGCIRMEYSNPRAGAEQEACFTITPSATPSPSPTPSPAPSSSGGPSTAAQSCNWAGTWAHGPRGLPNLVLTLSGTSLSGTFGGFGRVNGTVSGNSFQGNVTNDRGQRENLEMRIGFGTDGGGRLGTSFISCSYMAVKVGNQGWTDFQR